MSEEKKSLYWKTFDTWADYVKRIAEFAPTFALVEEVVEMFELTGQGSRVTTNGSITGVDLSIHKVQKIEEMTPILRWLAKKGYHQIGDAQKMEFGSKPSMRWDLENGAGKLELWAYFGDGAECKMVEVGTKEVPVFEMQCDGDDPETKDDDLPF